MIASRHPRRSAPQERPDSGDQFHRLGNAGQISVGAAVETMDLVFDIDESRGDMKHGNCRRSRIGFDAAANLESVDIGQLDIKNHQVGERSSGHP